MKLRVGFILLCFLVCATVFSQEKYGELTVSQPEELNTVVRNDSQSVLIVISEVPDLQFENTRQIFEMKQRGASEWQIYVAPDSQSFTIQAPGYLPIKTSTMYLKPKRAYRLKVSLVKPVPGMLLIKTKPAGVSFRLNGAPIAEKTPYRLDDALPGSYYIQLSKEGFLPKDTTLLVESVKVALWETKLTQIAVRVRIDLKNKKLQDVNIFIDGEAKGLAPGWIYLSPGWYKLKLQKDGFSYKEKFINIPPDKEEIRFVEKLGTQKSFIQKAWLWYTVGSVVAAIIGFK